ncbi:hypothetical protein [Streptomyces sp. NPDC096013]|uniref:hypothetical protein n=1 Tax=Streptomyces sp. NPDC096013 TaxID=3366069 RepID=UPI0038202DB6
MRHDLPHSALAVLFEVDRSTVSTAIWQVWPLLAARGFAVSGQPAIRLRTMDWNDEFGVGMFRPVGGE